MRPALPATESARAAAPHRAPEPDHATRRILIWVAVLGAVLYVAYCGAYIARSSFTLDDGQRYFCLFDDAMISLRYGWNLAHGHGLVWNRGEYVEGYTNPLLTLLMSAVCLVTDRRSAVLFVQLLGIPTLLLIGWLAARVYAGIRAPQAAGAALVVAGTLAYYPLIFWSLMGMETGLVTAGLLATLAASFAAAAHPSIRRMLGVSALVVLTYLARPDGLVLTLPALLYVVVAIWRSGAARAQRLAALLLPMMAALILHVAWRYSYYGELVPNTYTLKVAGVPLSARLENGLIFLGLWPAAGRASSYLFETWPALAAAGAAVLWRLSAGGAAREQPAAGNSQHGAATQGGSAPPHRASARAPATAARRPQPRARALLLGITVLLALAYQVYVGGDPWSYWRMLAPIFPLLLILTVSAASELAGAMRTLPRRALLWRSTPALLATLVLVGAANARFWPEWMLTRPAFSVAENRDHVQTALALNRVLAPEASIGLLFAGAVAYFTDFRAVDFLGKCDPRIARVAPDLSGAVSWDGLKTVPGHNKYDLTYSIVERQPDYVDRLRWGAQNVAAGSNYYSALVAGRSLFLRSGSPHINGCALGAAPAGATPAGATDVAGVLHLGEAQRRGGTNIRAPGRTGASHWSALQADAPASLEFALESPARGYYRLEAEVRSPTPFPLRALADQIILSDCAAFPAASDQPRWQPLGTFFLKKGTIRLVLESDRFFPELSAVRLLPVQWQSAAQ